MKTRLPIGLWIVAIFQFVAPLILPPVLYARFTLALLVPVALLFVLLGVNLLRRQAWSRVATIFVQGFNIIVRLLLVMSNAVQGRKLGNPLDVALLGSCFLSMALSAIILYYVDLPDVQVVMQ
ncbi:MAG: hypothetical protein V1772_00280 [Chloroflexota bacterium]